MPFWLNNLVWGLFAPLLLAAILRLGLAAFAGSFFQRRSATERATDALPARHIFAWETCLPYVAGAGLGYFVLRLGNLPPEAHYEWLPAMVGLATLVACLADLMPGPGWARACIRVLGYAATAAIAGYLFMPTWEGLLLPYPIYLAAWITTAAVVALAIDFSKAPQHPAHGGTWPWAVAVLGTTLATAFVIGASESLRFTQMAGLAFSTTAGLALAGGLRREAFLPNLGLPLGVHLAGIMLIAKTNSYSDVPWLSYVLPLVGLVLAAGGSVVGGKFSTAAQAWVILLLAAIPATIAVILAALAG